MSNNLLPLVAQGGFSTTGNITAVNITANTFVSNSLNVVTAGNLFISSQYGLGTTGTILEQDGTLELIGNGTGCVIVGWDSSYGNLGNVATISFNETGNTNSVLVRTGNRAGTEYSWKFDGTGVLTLPGEGIVRSNNDTIVLQSWDTANSIGRGLRVGDNGGLYLEQGSDQPWLNLVPNAGNAQIYPSQSTAGAAGHDLSITAGAADQTDFYTTPGGNVNIMGGQGASNDGGGGGQGGSVNISAGVSSDSAGVPGNVTINTFTNAWNFDNTGNLTIPSSSGGLIKTAANGSIGITAINGGSDNPAQLMSWRTTQAQPDTIVSTYANSATVLTNVNGTMNTWSFDNTGNLSVAGSIIMPPGSTLTGNGGSPAPSLSGFSSVAAQQVTSNISLTLAIYANDAARNAAIPTPTAGMLIFNTAAANFQGYNGTSWGNLTLS